MKIINQKAEIIMPTDTNDVLKMLKNIEDAGRTCYKSKGGNKIDKTFLTKIIDNQHESVLEHSIITIKLICDRGVSHELVRHRLASYTQESTRYCNYSKDKFGNELTFIKPCFWNEINIENYQKIEIWQKQMQEIENAYFKLLEYGAKPEQARSILPNSLKTEIVLSTNIRELRHILKLRTSHTAHPQIRELMQLVLGELNIKFKGYEFLFRI